MGERIFYCPVDGRITSTDIEKEAEPLKKDGYSYTIRCEHCRAWYNQTPKFKAKRTGES